VSVGVHIHTLVLRTALVLAWTVDCAGTRAFAASCCDHELASRTNSFIEEHVRAVIERSQEFLRLPSIIVDVVGKYCSRLLIFRYRLSVYADLMINLRPPTCPEITEIFDLSLNVLKEINLS